MSASAIELAVNRANTQRYIDLDPTSIALIPRQDVWVNGTLKEKIDLTVRAAQNFHIIWAPSTGIVSTSDGITRKFDFILVGNYSAQVGIGDHWFTGPDTVKQDNEIDYVFPSNDYEVKCGGTSYGGKPSG